MKARPSIARPAARAAQAAAELSLFIMMLAPNHEGSGGAMIAQTGSLSRPVADGQR